MHIVSVPIRLGLRECIVELDIFQSVAFLNRFILSRHESGVKFLLVLAQDELVRDVLKFYFGCICKAEHRLRRDVSGYVLLEIFLVENED